MKRRKALKNIGVSVGTMMAVPMAISLLQSCQNEPKSKLWAPSFFTNEEGVVVKNLIDIILPTTDDMAGAIDLNLHMFVDSFIGETYDEKSQTESKQGIEAIMKSLKVSKNEPASKISKEKYDNLLKKYLRATKEQKELFAANKEEKLIMDTLSGITSLTVWSFKTSEEIGKNVMIYDPIPGEEIGCTSLMELTGGMAYTE